MVCLGTPYHFRFFKGCLPHILLGAILNTLSQIVLLKQIKLKKDTTKEQRRLLPYNLCKNGQRNVLKFRFWHYVNLRKLINFYSPWNEKKTIGFLIILGGNRSQLICVNSLNNWSGFWRWSLTSPILDCRLID